MSTGVSRDLRRVHLIGIGGAGMSGIARILLARGAEVSGSDLRESRALLSLRALGARVAVGHGAANLDRLGGPPTVVVSSAIRDTNPELAAARAAGLTVLHRSEALAELMAGRRAACVAGTHGKTSTTSMLTVALQHCGLDPSFAIGGDLTEAGSGAHHGSGDVFVAEADESDGSFLAFTPAVAVVTNVEADHLDHHGTEAAYAAVFDAFLSRIEPGGVLVACADDPGAAALAERAEAAGIRVRRYGAAVTGRDDARIVSYTPTDHGGLAVMSLAGTTVQVRVAVPGAHMAGNAVAALLSGVELGGQLGCLLAGLAAFGGVRRRFEFRGNAGGVRVYDDYAHHPTEVEATLRAARPVAGNGRLVVAFQPHLYSRTRLFAADFGRALGLADEVVVLDVYGAREDPEPGVSGALIADAVTLPRSAVHYEPVWSQVPARLADLAGPGDLVLTMGAGDITVLAGELVAELDRRAAGRAARACDATGATAAGVARDRG
ncbi:MAG TPA: UDP-N-acetylmuramate--L-alanine ligase [Pseudonocardiaceae bacterium]